MSGALFEPFRALGYVCNHVPFSLQPKGSQHFVTTVIGEAYHIYNCDALRLVSVGQVGSPITCVLDRADDTYVASRQIISRWRRGKRVQDYPHHRADVTSMVPFGQQIVSVDADNTVHVLEPTTGG